MTGLWRDRLGAAADAASRYADAALAALSRPRALRRLKGAAILLSGLWGVASLVAIAWSLLPEPASPLPPLTDIVNPVRETTAAAPSPPVDIERLASWHLFGDPDSAGGEELTRLEAQRVASRESRAGIEDDARETRLPLLLRGVVSSSDDGLGYAMIEHRGEQSVYAVGDELPVAGRARLAKVLPSRVVIDNAGNYELLTLFEESDLMRQAGQRERAPASSLTPRNARGQTAPQSVQVDNTGLAAQYRDRLYSDPQSLAEVVQVAPVRRGGDLLGYRLAPGRAREDFQALGFESGDIVTAVNGMSLSDPANTLRLYQAMRDERSAVFELQRGGSELVLSVQLPENGNVE